jgi:glycine hydroxymethyltransferase
VSTDSGTITPESRAYRAALEVIGQVEPGIAAAISAELTDQRASLKLIASENYASPAVLLAMGNWLSDKYAEGTIGRRFYAGCANIDTVETIASEHARELFGAQHAYVQPHSGIDANLVAYWAILAHRIESPALEQAGARAGQRPQRAGLGAASAQPRQSAADGHVPGCRGPPHPRVQAQHLREDV